MVHGGAWAENQLLQEADIYGFPMVENYRVTHAYFVDPDSPEFKAPWNQIDNSVRVYAPEDKGPESRF